MKRKKLVIVSHTAHYRKNDAIVGWAATVNEVNYLSDFWEEVEHVACFYDGAAPESSAPYTAGNVKFVALSPTGGERAWEKLKILWHLPATILKVGRSLRGATEVQFRSPTGIGVYLLPVFSFFFKRRYTFWVKYAGNWAKEKVPRGYGFQRWWLKNDYARCKVTINGFWDGQPAHCLSFENPCLTDEDIARGRAAQAEKRFAPPFRLVFVGRLEEAKGVGRIIDALRTIDSSLIERIDFVGDGPARKEFEKNCSFMGKKAVFHGFLNNQAVHEILSRADFFLLPSSSEGFPKVIAEAGCYGAVPVVSDVGSIGHYVTEENGFLWNINGRESYSEALGKALTAAPGELAAKSKNMLRLAQLFTFENYRNKLERMVFNGSGREPVER